MSTETIVILVVLALLIGSLPSWPYSQGWGYGPSGLLTVIGVIVLLWLFFGNAGSRNYGGSDAKPLARTNNGDINGAAREVGDGLHNAGQDIKRSIHDATR